MVGYWYYSLKRDIILEINAEIPTDKIICFLGFASKWFRKEEVDSGIDETTEVDSYGSSLYVRVHCIILSTFLYVWNYNKKESTFWKRLIPLYE